MIPPGILRRVLDLSGRAAGSGDVAQLGEFRRREIAADHTSRRNGGAKQTGIENLIEIFEAGKEEQLVAVLVEIGAGNQDRATDGDAGIVVFVLRPGLAVGVEQRVVGVHRVVSGIEEPGTVEILAAGLRDRTDYRGTLLIFSAEIRHLHLELGDHVRIRIHRRVAIAARVGDVRAIRRDVQRVGGQAVVRVGVIQRTLAACIAVAIDADGLATVIRLVRRAIRDAETRHDLDELGRVAADLHEVLEFLGGERGRFFAGIHRSDWSAVPVTSTVSEVVPTFKLMSRLRFSPPPSEIPVIL